MAYPQPADQQIMKACASDYYSISGNCCPKCVPPKQSPRNGVCRERTAR